MYVIDRSGGSERVLVKPVVTKDFKSITKSTFHFDWRDFAQTELWKLCLVNTDEILGVLSLSYFINEERVHINLIACKLDCTGQKKRYDRIAGCLFGWAGDIAVRRFGHLACISLVPKTKLIPHYCSKYEMKVAGNQLYLDGKELFQLIKSYCQDED